MTIISLLILCLITLSSCDTPYDNTKSVSDNAVAIYNSPASQAELNLLTQIGTSALNAWIQSQTGVVHGQRLNKAQFIRMETARASAEHPGLSKTKIRAAITQKLKGA